VLYGRIATLAKPHIGYGFGWRTNDFSFLSAARREQLLALGTDLRPRSARGSCVAYNCMIRFLDTRRTEFLPGLSLVLILHHPDP